MKGCIKVVVYMVEEHKLKNNSRRTFWILRGALRLLKNKTLRWMLTLAHANNLELIQIFKRTRKMQPPIIPLGKHTLNMF
jgi:hypothetical protein